MTPTDQARVSELIARLEQYPDGFASFIAPEDIALVLAALQALKSPWVETHDAECESERVQGSQTDCRCEERKQRCLYIEHGELCLRDGTGWLLWNRKLSELGTADVMPLLEPHLALPKPPGGVE